MLKISKIFLLIIFVVFGFFIFGEAKAGATDNVSGWAWSENIGWVSFNCTDLGTCGTLNYGVNIASSTGVFSGYAWSENIGWISFNRSDTGAPPGAPDYGTYLAQVDLVAGQVSGWARALAYGGGWDGWIKMSDGTYNVNVNLTNGDFHDWAWSDMVIGWLSFNSTDPGAGGAAYKVVTSLNQPPTAVISCDAANCGSGSVCNANWIAYNRNCIYRFLNQSTDPNNNIKKSIWSIFYSNGNPWQDPYLTCNDAPATPENEAICNLTLPTLPASQSYYVKLYVEDTGGLSNSTTHDFYVRRDAIAEFECSLKPSEGWKSCGNFKISGDEKVYFRSINDTLLSRPSEGASTITSFSWTFEDGTPSSSSLQNPSAKFQKVDANSGLVTLTIIDDVGRTDTTSHQLQITTPLPKWKEIPPL